MKRVPPFATYLVLLAIFACEHPTSPLLDTAERLVRGTHTSSANEPVTNAVYTIVNLDVDGPGHCGNGQLNPQNCNIYDGKKFVWLGGEAVNGNNPNSLPNGTYFFSVLEPGGQNNPNDGGPNVLSDLDPTTNTGAGDSFHNRTFNISAGVISYEGSHDFSNNKIRLFPYDDTPNPGGEYIMAVCSLAEGYPVDPSRCKYDAFKVKTAEAPPPPPTPEARALSAAKSADGSYDNRFVWGIAKAVDQAMVRDAAGSATFNYTVTVNHDAGTVSNVLVKGRITVSNPNASAVSISGITDKLSDGTVCSIADVPASLPPGDTSLQYSCSLASLPSGSIDNTATVSWPEQILSDDSHSHLAEGSVNASVPGVRFTANAIDGSAKISDTFAGALGTVLSTAPSPTTFTYSRTVTGAPAGTCTSYDNTATFSTNTSATSGSASQTVRVCVGKDLSVSKTAAPSFMRAYNWTISKAVDKTLVKDAAGNATFGYTVKVDRTLTDSDWKVNGRITVSNPNDWEAVTFNVADAIDNGGSCTIAGGSSVSVPANSSVDVDYACAYGSAPTQAAFSNTATASWDRSAYATPSGSASGLASGAFGDPTKIVDGSVNVTDTYAGALGTVSSADPSPATFTYSRAISGAPAGTCTNYDNTATFTTNTSATSGSASQSVLVCVGQDLKVSKTAAPSFTRAYSWTISKVADKTVVKDASGNATFGYTVKVDRTSTDSDWKVNGRITVSNPNDWQAVTFNVADAIDNGGNCTVAGGGAVSVPASSSVGVDYVCSYGSNPAPAAFANNATASWDKTASATPSGSASGSASGAFGEPTKIVDGSVNVTDTYAGALGTVSSADPSPATFTYSRAITGAAAGTCTSYDNTATFTTNTSATSGSASQSVKVCVGKDLTVTKTAAPSFTRAYSWAIAKTVDKTLVRQVGGTATFAYTVKVNRTSADRDWKVNGKITVSNPNDWEAVALNVGDAINNGGNCTVAGGGAVSVPASSSVDVDYVCSYASTPAPAAFANTVTASWDKAASATPGGSASGSASGAFGDPTKIVDGSANVTDSYAGVLGTVNYLGANPTIYSYNRTLAVVANVCNTFGNTASYAANTTGANGSASQSVMVCGNVAGGLTIGFWQNKNGQTIVTGGSSTAGVCNSATWLRSYAPFQDLGATASCASVASYVFNLIKAANASGASMNAMLKAQMMATALDVYFSDAALGGNKILAPAAVGGVKVDLTAVCSVIASCASTYQNVSAAFGGATSLTASQILAYAASKSNAGGTTWYAQVKSVQELAKNTFDAINNAVALAAP